MDTEYGLLVVTPVLSLGANVLAQATACRLTKAKRLYLTVILGFGVGLLCSVIVSAWALAGMERLAGRDWWAFMAFNLVSTAALGYGYFQFVSLNVNSLRIRVLKEIVLAGGTKPADNLLALYDAGDIIRVRLDRLTRAGDLVKRDERYYSGRPFFLTAGKLIEFAKYVVLGRGSRLGREPGDY
jgi:hypothetical protein